MTPDRWERISDIAANAMEISGPGRLEYVREACGADADLLNEVLRIVSAGQNSAVVDQPLLRPDFLRRMMSQARGLVEGEDVGGRYRIVRHLGAGGMGDVYEARDLTLDQRIALKTIRPEHAGDPLIIARFKREIQLARQVTHPNVCRVFDLASLPRGFDGTPILCLTMEYLEGGTLAQANKERGRWTFDDALPVLDQMLAALEAAHRAGVIHRDFKPANVMLARRGESWHASVTDFGLARGSVGDTGTLTASGLAGTPAYMAPEQLVGSAAGPPADLYAFGAVMYEMACGAPPWSGDVPHETAMKRLEGPVRAPSAVAPGLDARWERIILRLLEREPERRYESAAAVRAALRGEEPEAPPLARPARAFRVSWRDKRLAVAAGIGALAVSGVLYSNLEREDLPPEALRWRRQGEEALENRAYLTARGLFERSRVLAPRDARATLRLAQTHIELESAARAQQLLLEAVGMRIGEESDRLLLEGLRAASTREWDASLRAFRARRDKAPAAARVSTGLDLLWALEKAERGEESLAEAGRLVALDAAHPAVNLAAGRMALRRNKEAEGTRLLAKAEESFRAIGNLEGIALKEVELAEGLWTLRRHGDEALLNRASEAVRNARQVSDSDGARLLDLRLRLLRSLILSMQGKYEESDRVALEAAEEAKDRQLGGTQARALLAVARTFIVRRDYGRASPLLAAAAESARVVQCQGCLGLAQYYRGYVAAEQSDCEEAEKFLVEASEALTAAGDRTHAFRTRMARCRCLRKSNRLDEAEREIAALERDARAANLDDAIRGALFERAIIAAYRARYPEALAAYEGAVAILRKGNAGADLRTALIDMALLRVCQGDFEGARRDLESVGKTTGTVEGPDSVNAALVTAFLRREEGDSREAVSQIRPVLERIRTARAALAGTQQAIACEVALESRSAADIEQFCAALWNDVKQEKDRNRLVLAGYSRAIHAIAAGKTDQAWAHAENAYLLAVPTGHLPNTLFAGLVALEAAQRAERWDRAADLATAVSKIRRTLDHELGGEGSKRFWRRLTFSNRWARAMEKERKNEQ